MPTLDTTVLALWGVGVPPYSARGLSQTLEPIDMSVDTARDINGALMDLSSSQFRKYKSKVTGTDQQPPAVDGVWPGHVVTVDCVAELCAPEYSLLQRGAVPGSEREETGFTFYRPRLEMMVVGFNTSTDEYGAQVGWEMDLEEV
jgi:hypothetical protein